MPAAQKQIALIIVRQSEGKRLAKPASNGGFYFPFKSDVVSIFRLINDVSISHFGASTAARPGCMPRWFTPLHHKLLIAYTLQRRLFTATDAEKSVKGGCFDRFSLKAMSQLDKFLEEEVKPSHPQCVADFRAYLDSEPIVYNEGA